jgi:endonuclease-8
MTATSAHGKHLFLHFDKEIVHVHLGLYGWFKLRKNKGQKPKDSVRLRIANDEYLSDLGAPTACELMQEDGMRQILNRLGPDPLKDEQDPQQAWAKIRKSARPIGALLMDQAVIAGIGNVYRAELLFLSNLNPMVSGKEVSERTLDRIWDDSVRLMKIGAADGKIKTVDTEHLTGDEVKLHGCTQYSYVYKRTGQNCRICNDIVKSAELVGRTVYWCPTCQG